MEPEFSTGTPRKPLRSTLSLSRTRSNGSASFMADAAALPGTLPAAPSAPSQISVALHAPLPSVAEIAIAGNGEGETSERDSAGILGKTTYVSRSSRASSAAAVTESGASGLPVRPPVTRYMLVSRILFWLTFIGVIVVTALVVWAMVARGWEPHTYGWAISGFFAALAVAISLHDIHMHIRHYVSPLQKHYVRIVAMVIIYAIQSWLALRFNHQRVYFEVARDLYEAFVLYSFHLLMVQFLGGKKKLAERLRLSGKARAKHLPGCCCLRPWRMGSRFVHRTTLGVYQYILLRTLVSIVALIAEATDTYKEGNWSPKYFYVYAVVIINISQLWALYCLGFFYTETRKWLKPLSPLKKFGLVKLIIFVSFWQSVAFSVAGNLGFISGFWAYSDTHEAVAALLDFCLCIELFIVSVGHHFVFSYRDFYSGVPGVVTPIMMMQQGEAAFDKFAAEASARARGRGGSTASGGDARSRAETDMSALTVDAGGAAVTLSSAAPSLTTAGLPGERAGFSASRPTSVSITPGKHLPTTMSAADVAHGHAFSATSSVPLSATRSASSSIALTPAQAASLSLGAGSSPLQAGIVSVVSSPGDFDSPAGAAGAAGGGSKSRSVSFAVSSATASSAAGTAAGATPSIAGTPLTGSLATATTAASASGATVASSGSIAGSSDLVPSEQGVGVPLADGELARPLSMSAALFELLPLDVIADTKEQLRSGFGLVHKWQKRKAEEAETLGRIRTGERTKKTRFGPGATAAAAAAGAAGGADGSAAVAPSPEEGEGEREHEASAADDDALGASSAAAAGAAASAGAPADAAVRSAALASIPSWSSGSGSGSGSGSSAGRALNFGTAGAGASAAASGADSARSGVSHMTEIVSNPFDD